MEKKKLLIALLLSVFVSYVNAQFCKQLTSEEQSKAKKRINIEQNEKRITKKSLKPLFTIMKH